ncbi:MAG: MobF family relaxase [Verrucomicrobiota bacterium]
MFKSKRIVDILYHVKAAQVSQAESGDASVPYGIMDEVDDPRDQTRKGAKQPRKPRYTDYTAGDDSGESVGRVFHFQNDNEAESFFSNPKDPFLTHGLAPDAQVMIDLAGAVHPRTGEKLRKDVKAKNADGSQKKQTVAFDSPFSAPKSVSVIWGIAEALNRDGVDVPHARAIERAQQYAVDKAVKWMFEQGLIVSRKNNRDRKGRNKVELVHANEVAGAIYDHKTSRSGDPQVHSHWVMLNLCRLPNGEIRTLDNVQMIRYQKTISNIYRTALAEDLRENLGIEFEGEKDWVEIAGVNEDLRKQFSKRREDMEKAARERGSSLDNKGYASQVALATRGEKDDIPPISDLAPTWLQQVRDLGYDPEEILASLAPKAEQVRKERETEEITPEKMKTAAMETLNGHFAVFEEREILAEFTKSYQASGGTFDEAVKHIEELKVHKELVTLEYDRQQDPIMTTKKILEMETEIIEISQKMKDRYDHFADPHVTESFISEKQYVDGEPAITVLDAMNKALLEGRVNEFATSSQRRRFGRLREAMTKKGGFNRKQLDKVTAAFEEIALANGEALPDEVNEAVNQFREIADNCPMMSEEQANFVRHLLGRDGVSVGEGSAGAGKTYALETVANVMRSQGKTPFILAPSWRATDVARIDTKTKEEYARAIQGFINRYKKGEIPIDKDFGIIVDEAGMVGHENMRDLLRIADETGARLILTGDRRQIQPVAAGNPLVLVSDVLGTQRIDQIRRQKFAWMRENSTKLASGSKEKALEALADYDNRGYFQWFDTEEQLIDKAAADYAETLVEKPNSTFLAMHPKNAMVRRFNELAREHLRKAGVIDPEDAEVKMDCIVRGADAQTMPVGFARGDRIILGETIEVDDVCYANGQIATVKNVWKDKSGEIYFALAFDDGKARTFSRADFVRHRELIHKKKVENGDKDIEPLLPKLQHAFATTETSAQGMTVDYSFILDPKHSYVAGTRHRWKAFFYGNYGAAHDILMSKKGGAIKLSNDGSMVNEDDETNPKEGLVIRKGKGGIEISEAEVKAEAFKMMTDHGQKWNAADSFKTPKDFLWFAYNQLKKKAQQVTESVGTTLKDFVINAFNETLKPDEAPMPEFTSSLDNALENVEFDNDNALESEESSMSAEQQKARKQKWRGGKPERRLITDSEKEQFERHSMLYFAFNRLGATWKHKGGENGRTSAKWGGKEYELKIGGDSVVVNHRGGKIWTFWIRGDRADGNRIWNLAARYLGMSKMEAMHELRKEVGTTPDQAEMDRMISDGKFKAKTELPAFKQQPLHEQLEEAWQKSYREEILAWNENTEEEAAEKKDALAKFDRAIRNWSNAQGGISDYLLERGITAETQRQFSSDMKLADKRFDSDSEVWFGLRDRANKIVGYFRKGKSKTVIEDGTEMTKPHGFATMASGGAPSLMGYRGGRKDAEGNLFPPSKIVLVEAHIDGLSYWQELQRRHKEATGSDEIDENILIISSTGQVTQQTQAAAFKYAHFFPESEIHIAPDSDEAGYGFYAKYLEAVTEARHQNKAEGHNGPFGKIVDARAGLEYNDWNNRIRGIKVDNPYVPPKDGEPGFSVHRDIERDGPVALPEKSDVINVPIPLKPIVVKPVSESVPPETPVKPQVSKGYSNTSPYVDYDPDEDLENNPDGLQPGDVWENGPEVELDEIDPDRKPIRKPNFKKSSKPKVEHGGYGQPPRLTLGGR